MYMSAELFIRLIADAAVIPVILIAAWALVFKIPKVGVLPLIVAYSWQV